VANIDPNYRPWQTQAALAIAEQFFNGTVQASASRAAERSDGHANYNELMARHIVAIMLAHGGGTRATEDANSFVIKYLPWQTRAARKIVEQFHDGTLLAVAARGVQLSNNRMSNMECMASQIVGIILAHLVNEPAGASGVASEQTLLGIPMIEREMDFDASGVKLRALTPQDAQDVLNPPNIAEPSKAAFFGK
jgi:hypothetical protein